ncbi:MAG: bifunctional protein-serine/threonine kinase/phosphatase [Verrucomicrobia subdivision 3 bacterium]|nr:bifunctional protein-serine/threonine kinase/phosphatase [Limisphaerales bacterium]
MHLKSHIQVTYGQASEAGRKEVNDDCLGSRLPEEPLLTTKGVAVVIADGVSAAEAGKEASEIAVQNFLTDYYDTPDEWTVKTAGHRVITAVNRWLFSLGRGFTHAQRGYVTTLSTLIIKSHTAHIFHIGDTRIWRWREGKLQQLTHDHALRLNDTDTQLTRAAGLDPKLDVDYHAVDVRQGDAFLLTTDGVHEYQAPEELSDTLRSQNGNLDRVCEHMVSRSLANASPDNLSCQLLRIDHLPDEEDAAELSRELRQRPFPPDLAPGMRMDGFEIEAEIDASKRSQIYRAHNRDTGHRIILKTPSVNYEDDDAYLERFIMEQWIARRIDNPHVVKATRLEHEPTFLYNAFEHVNGPTLSQWMAANPQPEIREVQFILRGLIRGLNALHRREVIHRDLKPGNVVLNEKGEAVIIDFGACYVAGIDEITAPIERDHVLGTVDFTAPEIRLGRRPDARSDQFSLGILAYQMLTGHHPYGAALEKAQSLRDFSLLEYRPSYEHNPLIPPWVDGALRKACAIDPKNRYEALSEFEYDLTHPNDKYLLTQPLAKVANRSLTAWKILAGVLLALVVALLILLMNR